MNIAGVVELLNDALLQALGKNMSLSGGANTINLEAQVQRPSLSHPPPAQVVNPEHAVMSYRD